MNENETPKPRPGVVKRPVGARSVCVACDDGLIAWLPPDAAEVVAHPETAGDATKWQVQIETPAGSYFVQRGLSYNDARALAESIAQELEAARG